MTLCDHLAVKDIYNPQSALSPLPPKPLSPLSPLPPSPGLVCHPSSPAMGKQADGSKQQAQPVKIQHKGETSQFGANKQEPLLSSSFPLCPALFVFALVLLFLSVPSLRWRSYLVGPQSGVAVACLSVSNCVCMAGCWVVLANAPYEVLLCFRSARILPRTHTFTFNEEQPSATAALIVFYI